MKKIKSLLVVFENELAPDQIGQFRAAVIEHTDRKEDLFHNHRSEKGYHYRYPLIQYKRIRNQAALLCLEQGTQTVHAFLGQPDLQLRIGRSTQRLVVDRVALNNVLLQVWTRDISYRLRGWQALSQKNYRKWRELDGSSLALRVSFLERILIGNILSACQGLGFFLEDRLVVKITSFQNGPLVKFKQLQVQTFNVDFTANVSLPDHIGLGKGASTGFGVLTAKRQHQRQPEEAAPKVNLSSRQDA